MSRFEFIKDLQPKRLVLKIGSSLLADSNADDGLNQTTLNMLRKEIVRLRKAGIEVLLISSGAVNTGRHWIARRYDIKPQHNPDLARRQALSAIGQTPLLAKYTQIFSEHKIPVAQILITARDFRERRSYLNIGHTIQELMKLGALPVINENDTVATDELQFGENDLLSAACAALFEADLLIILTSVEGFLIKGKRLGQIKAIQAEHRMAAGGPLGPGSGGMQTKLRAGELCQLSGQALAILPGYHASPISALLEGADIGTLIHLHGGTRKIGARKRWLLFASTKGGVVIDAGARQALAERGSSLLPAGILEIKGDFYAGEAIEIMDADGILIGRGLSSYSSREVQPMLGLNRSQLGQRGLTTHGDAIIHRNDMILEIQ